MSDGVVTLVIEYQNSIDKFGWVGEDEAKLKVYETYKNRLTAEFRRALGEQGLSTDVLLNPPPKGYVKAGNREWQGPENYYIKKGGPREQATEKRMQQLSAVRPRMRYPRLGAFEVSIRCSCEDLPSDFQVWSKLDSRRWPKVDRLANDIARLFDDEERDKPDLLNRMQELFKCRRTDSCNNDLAASAMAPLNRHKAVYPPMFFSLKDRETPVASLKPVVKLDSSANQHKQLESRVPTRPSSAIVGGNMPTRTMRPLSANIGGGFRAMPALPQLPTNEAPTLPQLPMSEPCQSHQQIHSPSTCLTSEPLKPSNTQMDNSSTDMEETNIHTTQELIVQDCIGQTDEHRLAPHCTEAPAEVGHSDYDVDDGFEDDSEVDTPAPPASLEQVHISNADLPAELHPSFQKHSCDDAEEQPLHTVCETEGESQFNHDIGELSTKGDDEQDKDYSNSEFEEEDDEEEAEELPSMAADTKQTTQETESAPIIPSLPLPIKESFAEREKVESEFEDDYEDDPETDFEENATPDGLDNESSEFEIEEGLEEDVPVKIDKSNGYDYAEDNESYSSDDGFED